MNRFAPFLDRPIAHRALHDLGCGRPENSRAAIAAACQAGYGIEIDVQPSADGHAMVFHDYDLGRLTDAKGAIGVRSATDLARLTLNGGADGIPTLPEVLQIIEGRVPLVIEIKDQDGAMGSNVGALEKAVLAAIADYAGPFAIMSFNPHSIGVLRASGASCPLGLVTCDFAAADWPTLPEARRAELAKMDLTAQSVEFISHGWRDLHSPRVAAAKAKGISVICWTVRSAEEEKTALKVADAVTFEGYLA